jgi:hypothetical protein
MNRQKNNLLLRSFLVFINARLFVETSVPIIKQSANLSVLLKNKSVPLFVARHGESDD